MFKAIFKASKASLNKGKDINVDIESELDRGLAEEWMKEKKENHVPFSDWFLSHSNYIPKDTDTSSLDKYQKDMEHVVKEVSDVCASCSTYP